MRRKFETIRKVGKLLLEEEKEIKEDLARVRRRILSFQEELLNIRAEIDGWTSKLKETILSAEEISEILSYIDSLSLKLKEVTGKIETERRKEKELEERLREKKREGISFKSVEKKLEEAIASEERRKETLTLDEYTRVKRWFKVIVLVFFLLPVSAFGSSIEKNLEKPPPELVKVLKNREKELREREAKLKVKEKFLQTLKDDLSFLLSVLDERFKRQREASYGASQAFQSEFQAQPLSPEVKKLYKLVSRLPPDEGGQILSNVKPHIVAFLLLHMNSMQAANLLANMEVKQAAKVVELLYSIVPRRAKLIFEKLDEEHLKGLRKEKSENAS